MSLIQFWHLVPMCPINICVFNNKNPGKKREEMKMFEMESTENPIEWKYWWNESKFESIFSSFSFNYFQRTKPHYSDFIFFLNTHIHRHILCSRNSFALLPISILISGYPYCFTKWLENSFLQQKNRMCAFSLIFFYSREFCSVVWIWKAFNKS